MNQVDKMSTERNFTEVGGSNDKQDIWNPKMSKENKFHFDPEDKSNNILEGYLIDQKTITKKDKTNTTLWAVHEFTEENGFGAKLGVWGNVVIDAKLEQLKLGSFVRIEYAGRKSMLAEDQYDPKNYHIFKVMTDPNALPYQQALNVSKGQTNETADTVKNSVPQKAAMPVKNSRQATSTKPADTFSGDDLPF